MKKHWPELALLIVLVVVGMNIKQTIQNSDRIDDLNRISDSLIKHPDQIQAVESGLDTTEYYGDDGVDSIGHGQIDTIKTDFENHSELKPINK